MKLLYDWSTEALYFILNFVNKFPLFYFFFQWHSKILQAICQLIQNHQKLFLRQLNQINRQKYPPMIPWLAEKYGAERMSYLLFGMSQVLIPLAFIYANDNKFNIVETSMLRGIGAILLNYGIARYYDMTLDYKFDVNFINLIKRNVIMVIHGLAMAAAQFYLPLPIVHTISFCSPIFVFVIDYFQNGIRINHSQFYCLMASIIGIICTINDELVSKLMDKDYEMHTEFKNYISLDPYHFSLYGLALIGVMFMWAYGLLRLRTFYKNTHVHSNFHLGVMFIMSSGFLYPMKVYKPSNLQTLFFGIFMTGLPMALGQLMFVAGLALNKKTGQLVILTGIPVFIGYLLSYFRYREMIKPMELIGSILIFIGLLGVINCAQKEEQALKQSLTNTTKIAGDPANTPKQMMFNVIMM